jgi:predicted Zn-dependent protease
MTQKSSVAPPNRVGIRRKVWLVTGLVTLATGVYWWCQPVRLPDGVSQRNFDIATRRYHDLYGRSPARLDVLSIAGELAVREGRLPDAVACFRQIPIDHPRYGPSARLQEAQVLLRLNRAELAEQSFRDFLGLATATSSESVVTATKWLNYILSVELRFEDRQKYLADIHTTGSADIFDSKQLFFPNLLIWNSATGKKRLDSFIEADPRNFRLRVAQGRYLAGEGQLDDGLALLGELHRQRPGNLPSTAALLECLFEKNDWSRFGEIARSLPQYEPDEPWLMTRMRGEFALQEKRWDDAVFAFERLSEAEPANPWSSMGLAKAYGEQNLPAKREQMLARSLVLSRIRVSLSNVREDSADPARKLSDECRQIGLGKAAIQFDRHAQRIEQSPARATSASLEE